jgi:hypothetical protein
VFCNVATLNLFKVTVPIFVYVEKMWLECITSSGIIAENCQKIKTEFVTTYPGFPYVLNLTFQDD